MKEKYGALLRGGRAQLGSENLPQQMQVRSGGISILDGPPGCGNSTLIAQLDENIVPYHVFYVCRWRRTRMLIPTRV